MSSKGFINADPQSMKGAAGRVKDKAAEYCNHYKGLLELVKQMVDTDWPDSAGKAFYNQISGFEDDFKKMKELMDEYAEFLEKTAQSYVDKTDSTIKTIQGLQN